MKQSSLVLLGVLVTIHGGVSHYPMSRVDSNCGCNEGWRSLGLGYYNGYRPCGVPTGGYGGLDGVRRFEGVTGGFGNGLGGGFGGFNGVSGGFGRFAGVARGFGGAAGFGSAAAGFGSAAAGFGSAAAGFGSAAAGTVVQPVAGPGRIVVQEAAQVVPDYVEGDPIVLQQESAPRFVFGDSSPVRITHFAKPAVIEHFETPYIVDVVQRSAFINHASEPVIIDHYDEPEFITDAGLPVVYEAIDCEATGGCGGCGGVAPLSTIHDVNCGCH